MTFTREQSIVGLAGSVTLTVNGTASPKLNSRPGNGTETETVGPPTVMTTLAVAVRPPGSRTVRVAVYWPLAV